MNKAYIVFEYDEIGKHIYSKPVKAFKNIEMALKFMYFYRISERNFVERNLFLDEFDTNEFIGRNIYYIRKHFGFDYDFSTCSIYNVIEYAGPYVNHNDLYMDKDWNRASNLSTQDPEKKYIIRENCIRIRNMLDDDDITWYDVMSGNSDFDIIKIRFNKEEPD